MLDYFVAYPDPLLMACFAVALTMIAITLVLQRQMR
jgi:hypothetical protein